MNLKEKKCVPCEGGMPSFTAEEIKKYIKQLPKGWEIVHNPAAKGGVGKKIRKEFKFKSYPETMAFVNKVALIAQAEDHHPDLHVYYSKVAVELWTHAVGGLSENDFILAAKID